MLRELQRYVGHTIEIIYQDRHGTFTKRRVQLHSINNGNAKVFCLERRAPRLLKVENIFAVSPVTYRAS